MAYTIPPGDTDIVGTLTRILADIDVRLKRAQEATDTLPAAEREFRANALRRISADLAPMVDTLRARIQRGVLTATSDTEVLLVGGVERTWVIAEADRTTFAPSPYVLALRRLSMADTALLRVTGWDPASGAFTAEVLEITGNPGPHTDWEFVSGPGVITAQRAWLAEGRAARAAIEALEVLVKGYRDAAAGSATASGLDRTQTGLDRVATGNDRAATLILRDQAVAAAGTVDTSKFLQLDGLRQLTGKLLLAASAAGRAAFNMPSGTDPSAPAEGDVWYAGNGILRAFVAGAVHRLPFLGLAQSWGAVQTFLSGTVLTPVSADPASPVEGQRWTRTGLGFFGYINGASRRILDASMKATTAQAQAGTDDVAFMTPAATVAAIQANGTAEIAALARNVRELQLFAWSDRQNIVNGIVDPLSDGSDLNGSASSGYSLSGGMISPQTTGGNVATQGFAISNPQTNSGPSAFDGTTSSSYISSLGGSANTGAAYVGQDFGAGNAKDIAQMVLTNSGNSGDCISSVLIQYSDNMSAWTTVSTSGVSNSAGGTTTLTIPDGTGAHRGWRLLANSGSNGGGSNGWAVAELTMLARAAANMVVQSVAFALSLSSPAVGRMAVQMPASAPAFTINTDFAASISRDGGATFTVVPLALAQTLADGSKIYDGSVNLADQPAGSSLVWKVSSATAKGIPFTGVIAEMRAS